MLDINGRTKDGYQGEMAPPIAAHTKVENLKPLTFKFEDVPEEKEEYGNGDHEMQERFFFPNEPLPNMVATRQYAVGIHQSKNNGPMPS